MLICVSKTLIMSVSIYVIHSFGGINTENDFIGLGD